ncbi:phosphotransferase [Nonomuraea sp. NPDC050783]|uniref:phosphotransferase n=1 Tax=Nonomuraea sp. NPDC050783 TaxID=3154634 RepID=UPI0034659B38
MSGVPVEEVAAAYGLGEPVGPATYAARGELGRIWRLDTRRGSWAVKEALVPLREADARADVAFQLAAAEAGVRLPRPVRTVSGDVVAGGRWRVYEWAELEPSARVGAVELGAVTARLHLVGHPAQGPAAAWFAEPVGHAGWAALAAAAERADPSGQRAGRPSGSGKGTGREGRPGVDAGDWREAFREALPELVALDELVVPPDPAALVTCHLDVNPENVRRARDGGVVVLDWENSGPAIPGWELAKVLADLPEEDAGVAYRAYLEAGGPARVREAADFSMAVAEQGHLLEFYAGRALAGEGEESGENRARARDRLCAMLARPLTRARIDRLLDRCRQAG